MYLKRQKVKILSSTPNMLNAIEYMARISHKSSPSDEGTTEKFIKRVIFLGHESVLRHGTVSFEVYTSRAIAQQLLRHKFLDPTMESQRYVNYLKTEGRGNLCFIKPAWLDFISIDENTKITFDNYMCLSGFCSLEEIFFESLVASENAYFDLLEKTESWPEEARDVLPMCVATRIGITTNIQALRNLFRTRLFKKGSQDLMRELVSLLYKEVYNLYPILFEDLQIKHD
ncbi:FAD-dependent thymidylate synthase [Candidatus Pacearchaeota archaeon]|jgi:thymidylate synthase (FAD)|nr:FAD-dependent thymidylate synthase [Candidatus Pacearchaeota archaeon]